MNVPDCFYRVSVKALILDENKRFLLFKHSDTWWDLPGGGLEFGEDPHLALKREIFEETEVEVDSIDLQPSYFITAPKTDMPEVYFANVIYRITLKDNNFQKTEECIEARYVDEDDLSNLKVHDTVKEFIKVYDPENHNL